MGLIFYNSRGLINKVDKNTVRFYTIVQKSKPKAFQKLIQITITFRGLFMVNSKSTRRLRTLSNSEKTTFNLMKMAFPVGTMLIG